MQLHVLTIFLIGLSISVAQIPPTKTRRGPPPARYANAPPAQVWGPQTANGDPVPSATQTGGTFSPSQVPGQAPLVNYHPNQAVHNSPVVRGPPYPRYGSASVNTRPVIPTSRTKSLGFLGGPDPYVPPMLPPTTMPPQPVPTVRYDVPDMKKEEEEES